MSFGGGPGTGLPTLRVWPDTVTLSLSAVDVTSVSFGTASKTPTVVALPITAQDAASVTMGTLTVSPTVATATITAADLDEITIGGTTQVITPNVATLSVSGVDVTAAARGDLTISPTPATLTLSGVPLTFTTGSQTITPDVVSLTLLARRVGMVIDQSDRVVMDAQVSIVSTLSATSTSTGASLSGVVTQEPLLSGTPSLTRLLSGKAEIVDLEE